MTTSSNTGKDGSKHAESESGKPSGIDNPTWLLVILFLGIGALGIPLLRKSKAFSQSTKKWLETTVILYTIIIVLLLIAAIVGFLLFVASVFLS